MTPSCEFIRYLGQFILSAAEHSVTFRRTDVGNELTWSSDN
jgi:hypothetical protein